MLTGVVFPQTEIGDDPTKVRDYGQAAEQLGYSHILAYDHVLGASTKNRPDWRGPYTSDTMFHEPLVLFAYLAGITQKVEFVTGVIILPQRQTALVAKQAAELDVLSGGRLRLGVGIGWNDVEYEGLNENFRNRARRFEEQIEVLRLLWTQPVLDFHGQYHNITEAGINPLPVQRPIPLWIGANVAAGVERAGRIADGWFPQVPPDERGREMVGIFRSAAEQAGRDPNSLGIEARISLAQGGPDDWRQRYESWRDLGATHMSINTMGMGLASPDEHISAIERFKREVVDVGNW
ncbi:MAG TPA: LLM class F420-dependent oxidoreductase [Chloroflexia bacterium]|nr:LLM class F420-dependent oxidoreductase [Chloroflexia bacterium]